MLHLSTIHDIYAAIEAVTYMVGSGRPDVWALLSTDTVFETRDKMAAKVENKHQIDDWAKFFTDIPNAILQNNPVKAKKEFDAFMEKWEWK